MKKSKNVYTSAKIRGRSLKDSKNPIKNDNQKTRLSLIPPDAIEILGRVLTFGANKYAPWNWARGFAWSRLYDALQRHLNAWWNGEDKDIESGFSHLGHALCCLVFLVVHESRGLGKDDRFNFRCPNRETTTKISRHQ